MKSTLQADYANVKANLRRFEKNLTAKEIKSLERNAREILEESQDKYVPEAEGDLRDSGHLVTSPQGKSVSIVYDDWKAPIIHEHLSAISPPSWQTAEAQGHGIHWTKPGTGPKFLEIPWLEKSAELLEELGDDLQVDKIGTR